MAHRWHFFRAGGVDQVSLRDGNDLISIGELDQKLWVALAMPSTGVDLEPETLALLDVDQDGRIRVHDMREAVTWIKATFKRPDDVIKTADSVALDAIADAKVVSAAKRMLTDLGKPDGKTISVEDATAITKAFTDTVLNGDGVVIPASTQDPKVGKLIEDVIATQGAVTDRSGKPGVDTVKAEQFWKEVDARAAWLAMGSEAGAVLGDKTAAAAAAFAAVRAKIDDYFTRCKIAAFEPRGGAALAAQDAELTALAARTLSAADEELAKLPLAAITTQVRLPLASAAVNPAWAAKLATFAAATVTPCIGAREALTPADVDAIVAKLGVYETWHAAEPVDHIAALAADWIAELAKPDLRAELAKVIAQDAALAGEYDQITSVAKVVRFQRDFGRIARNFVSFSDFYAKQDGVFQCGTLYLDARALHLCVPVVDVAKHGALAASSDAFLVYCDITRGGKKEQIAAALTNGDDDNVFVGRNGIFYDRKGDSWDATVTKIIPNPISIRQAFWSPYKKLVRAIEDNVNKRAAAADAAAAEKMKAAGAEVAQVDQVAVKEIVKAEEPKKIDLGTVAAIGVAIGGIGTLFGVVLSAMFGLGAWLPIGVVALLLMISGPAMVLAWLKLRRRNLGPILDANGWAINSRARINVAFGAAMTELAKLPPGAQRSLDDPFADKRTPWRRWVVLAVIVVLAGSWYVGKLDDVLPTEAQSISVLGEHAPAFKKQQAEKAAADKAAADKAAADAKAKK